MTQTMLEKLRELAHPGRAHPQGFHSVVAQYQDALRAAADEIERLNAILQEKPEPL